MRRRLGLPKALSLVQLSFQQHEKPAVIPLPEEWCGGLTEDRASIMPDRDHFSSDFVGSGRTPLRVRVV